MQINRITGDQASVIEPAGLPAGALSGVKPGLPLHVLVSVLGVPDIGKQLSFGKRQIVCHHGDPATHLFWVEQGAVMVQQYLEDGRRQLVEIVLPGGICGFSQQNLYSATCETLQPSVLRACRKSELERHGELGWVVEHQVERQLCAAQAHSLALGRMTAQERVCALLSRFAEHRRTSRFERPSDGLNVHIQLPMTRGEIGDYLGLSLETVCRTLTDLQRKGIIEIGRHHGDVMIQSVKRLKRLGGGAE
jgi:CRP/FNR family transcriptional regulator